MSDLSSTESKKPDEAAAHETAGPEDASSVSEMSQEPHSTKAESTETPALDQSEEVDDDVPEEIQYEAAVGGTTHGIATNNALRALSRAARSFLLYEPRNQAIRDFLQEYRENMMAALSAYGPMELDIRPFEMVRNGEVVYLERDRERSLAFRLFRDGVRRLTLKPDVVWEELLRLLEILSIRYTGVRQSEDDIVTLLWKAGFKSIAIVAVEGFVPDEERPEGDLLAEAVPRKKKRRRRRKPNGGNAGSDGAPRAED